MSRLLQILAVAACISLPQLAAAQEQDCYVAGHVAPEHQRVFRSNVVLLDETVLFDDQQRKHIQDQLSPLVELGSETRVVSFSAYLDGRYSVPTFRWKIAGPLDESVRRAMRKDHLRAFDTCQEVAAIRTRVQLKSEIEKYFSRSSDKIAKSAILATVKEVGEQVFPSLSGRAKRLILVSDMLENSDVSSFYSGGGIRQIEPPAEIANALKRQLSTDLRGASVYVIGGGVSPQTEKSRQSGYRSTSVMGPLKEFWRTYFEKSNGKLIEFGQPLLLNTLAEGK